MAAAEKGATQIVPRRVLSVSEREELVRLVTELAHAKFEEGQKAAGPLTGYSIAESKEASRKANEAYRDILRFIFDAGPGAA